MNAFFTSVATRVATAAGQPLTFVMALLVIAVWSFSGPVFAWSDTWQLIVNTGTTIVTFLMVFLIQNSQNRDAAAMQAKLDELLRALDNARKGFIGIEHLTEDEIEQLRSALEQEAKGMDGAVTTADESVEHLLKRF